MIREQGNNLFDNCITVVSKANYKAKHGEEGLKIITPKQMFRRIPIALAQTKAGNASKNLLNVICQMIYFLYWVKEITKNVYNNIMDSIKL